MSISLENFCIRAAIVDYAMPGDKANLFISFLWCQGRNQHRRHILWNIPFFNRELSNHQKERKNNNNKANFTLVINLLFIDTKLYARLEIRYFLINYLY